MSKDHEQPLDALRAAVKASSFTYADIGFRAGRLSAGWIGEVLRGHYPSYRKCRLPRNVAQALESMGFTFPPDLVL